MATNRWGNPVNNNILRDLENNVLAGGSLEFYEAGTSTPLAVYSDSAQTVSAGSTLTADAFGLIEDFHLLAGTQYKIIAKDSGGTTKWTRDDVFGLDASVDSRLDSLEAAVGATGTTSNFIMNSSCAATHGDVDLITSSFQEGAVAEHFVKATNATAGSLVQGTTTDITSGFYSHASGVTTTDSASAVTFQSRVYSGDTGKFVSASGIFTAYVYHDTGSAVDVTVVIKKADNKDDFSSTTTIATSSATSVASGSWAQVTFSNAALGDCRNGIAIETSFACGVQTTKNYYYTMPQFTPGTTAIAWSPESSQIARRRLFAPEHISGLVLSLDADTSHDINITAGGARDSSDAFDIVLSKEFTKQIDAVWAAGDDAGGWPSGLNGGAPANNTWYYVYLIAKRDGTVDAGFDSSATATNLLADATGYVYYKAVGAILTDGSANIKAFYHVNDIGKGRCRILVTADVTFPKPLLTDYITKVFVVGAGGGGGDSAGSPTDGGNTVFGAFTAEGGGAGEGFAGYDGGEGGAYSFSVANMLAYVESASCGMQGFGGSVRTGGDGYGGENGLFNANGTNIAVGGTIYRPTINITGGTLTNAGSYGGGGGASANDYGGGGGGGAIVLINYQPSATTTITIGTGGSGGSTSGAGGNGYVEIFI